MCLVAFAGLLQNTSKEWVISVTRDGERLRKTRGLSYTRLRELLLSKISQLGYDPKPFGLHSLRASGATVAANADVPDRLFKRHGRWKSDSAKDGYIKDSKYSKTPKSVQAAGHIAGGPGPFFVFSMWLCVCVRCSVHNGLEPDWWLAGGVGTSHATAAWGGRYTFS